MGLLRRVAAKLTGYDELPAGFGGRLDAQERVLAIAAVAGGGHVVATSYGVWLPGDAPRRVGWHLISKAVWRDGTIVLIEASEAGEVGGAVLLVDLPPRRLRLAEPGKVPQVVHERVTGSIRFRHHRDLPGGGAWFLQRKIPGRDGTVLQVRADPGTDPAVVRRLAADVARQLPL
ncbi:hypothetical protein [Pseudonocardia asaccharolytica]|uniref:Uncharacterized protein n=1 Tax=Pseudonocardia asaccharolytica DSM 44247 = NBRC 16224 TaxID=1123024 RepID=A0A511CWS2_9PSEU|nr:hypothetical protein [Pseudonocardia asaccharolytica]GEL16927.1 hypothetical protein PA7_07640 [Pseudonocardia asaccharolytica DSM 44247 = NBRC 16224]